ncbi:IPT/TIG domain protein [compost metagenome]
MKRWIAIFIISFVCNFALAQSLSTAHLSSLNMTRLIKGIHQQPEYEISKVHFSPSEPKQGDKVTTFIELKTDFAGKEQVRSIVALKLNGQDVKVSFRNGTLWTSEAITLPSQGLQNYEVSLYIEDAVASEQIRASLLEVRKEIQKLNSQIAQETDLIKKAQLELSRDQKLTQKTNLEATLDSMKRVVAVKSVDLSVSPGNPSPTLPQINEVEPAIGAVAGGELLSVSGANLSSVTKVWIGGVEIPSGDFVLTNTSIEFTAPVLTAGMHEILVEAVVNSQTTTSRIKNAFYVLEPTSSGPVYPVAFAGLPKTTPSDIAVSLDGSQSYSANTDTLTYQWSVVSKPEGATSLDGVITNSTTVNPSFVATTQGNYVVSLVVANSTHSSVPSLTVITVGPKDPATITPTQIFGIAQKDGVYIGVFKVCSNVQQDLNYQLFNTTKVVLISGMRRGVLTRKECVNFQFSVTLSGSETVIQDIPFVLQTSVPFTKVIHLEVTPYAVTNVSLMASFSASQWSGERDLELLSLNSYVPLYGTYDKASSTEIIVKNTSTQPIQILNAPVITHLNGSTGVFTTDFPSGGITVPASGQTSLNLISSPGTFGEAGVASALMEWDVGPGEPAKVVMLKTFKLDEPSSYLFTVNMGSVALGSSFSPYNLRMPRDFFGGSSKFSGFSQIESLVVSDNAGGEFTLDSAEFTGSSIIGDIDFVRISGVDLFANFLGTTAGVYQGKVTAQIKGYLTPFEYVVNATFTQP